MKKPNPRKIFVFSIGLLFTCISLSCTRENPEGPVILKFNGKPIRMAELEVLGKIALSKKGLKPETEEGQTYFKQIAPNLYESLINTYTLKYVSELEDCLPTPEEMEQEMNEFKAKLDQQGAYEKFMGRFQISEEQLRDTLKYEIAIRKLQNKKFKEFTVEEPTKKAIHEFYYKNHQMFRFPNRIRASHIFLPVPEDADQETRQQIRTRLENLRKMIGDKPAQAFPGLARQYSQDPASAERGGDLGFIARDGRWPQAFKEAAFSLKEGEVSDVVKTHLGYHIIWVTDHEQSEEEATQAIKKILTNKKLTEQYVEWLAEERERMEIVKLFDPQQFQVLDEPLKTRKKKPNNE